MDLLKQFKFPSPFTRANLSSPQLVQDALHQLNTKPFQTDGELLCMWFLKPSDDPPSVDGLGSRPRRIAGVAAAVAVAEVAAPGPVLLLALQQATPGTLEVSSQAAVATALVRVETFSFSNSELRELLSCELHWKYCSWPSQRSPIVGNQNKKAANTKGQCPPRALRTN